MHYNVVNMLLYHCNVLIGLLVLALGTLHRPQALQARALVTLLNWHSDGNYY